MRDKYAEIYSRLKETNVPLFCLAFFVFLCAISVASIRLKLIAGSQDLQVTFHESLSLTFIGYFFNNFLPTAIGGDVAKAYYLSKKSDEKMGPYASVFVDRLIGLVTMVFMAFLALLFVGNEVADNRVRAMVYAITAISILAVIFMTNKNFARGFSVFLFFLKPIEEKLRRAYNMVHKYRSHKLLIYRSFLISIVSQFLFFSSLWTLAFSIGSRIAMADLLLRTPVISILSLLPSINGLGVRESSMVFLFGPVIGKGNAFAVSILWLSVLLITSIIGGVVYAVSPQFKIRLKEI